MNHIYDIYAKINIEEYGRGFIELSWLSRLRDRAIVSVTCLDQTSPEYSQTQKMQVPLRLRLTLKVKFDEKQEDQSEGRQKEDDQLKEQAEEKTVAAKVNTIVKYFLASW